MALRAGYYGVKRFLRDKLETIAGTYDDTIKSLFPRDEQQVLGAKNFIQVKASSVTVNGITFTVNSDGSVKATGTATANAILRLSSSRQDSNDEVKILTGDYILSGCTGGASDKYCLNIRSNAYNSEIDRIYDGEKKITLNNPAWEYSFAIIIFNGAIVTDQMFYPMLRLASDSNDTYEPYAMTNRELTDSVAELTTSAADQKTAINAIITAATEAADFAAFKTAMGAITPVTRSLSLTKEDITEEVKEAEPEKTVTKKRTIKK